MQVGIIGGTGWLGGALGRALIGSGRVAPADLVILNRSGARADYFGHRVSWAADVADLVARSEVVVVSVRPQDWPGLDLRAGGRLVISFMAGASAIRPSSSRAAAQTVPSTARAATAHRSTRTSSGFRGRSST